METGAGFPEQFVSISRANNAGLPRQEKSLVIASSRKCLWFEEASARARRLFGSRGETGRQGVFSTDEASGPPGSDGDLGAWTAYGKAEKRGRVKISRTAPLGAVETKCVGTDKH